MPGTRKTKTLEKTIQIQQKRKHFHIDGAHRGSGGTTMRGGNVENVNVQRTKNDKRDTKSPTKSAGENSKTPKKTKREYLTSQKREGENFKG